MRQRAYVEIIEPRATLTTLFKAWPNARNISTQYCKMLRQVKRTQHIATGWPNVRNMLCPTMLQDVALKCCERLARP